MKPPSDKELIGKPLSLILPDYQWRKGIVEGQKFLEEEDFLLGEEREMTVAQPREGGAFPCEISVATMRHEGRQFYSATIRDITQQVKHEQEIQRLAYFDALTNLPNRVYLKKIIENRLASSATERMAVMLIGLNRFSSINETLGHDAGDEGLRNFAFRLNRLGKQGVTVGHVGGDVFTVIVEGAAIQDRVMKVAADVLQLFNTPIEVKDLKLNLTACVGVSIYPDHADSGDQLFTKAEIALNHAKSRKCWMSTYEPRLERNSLESLEVAHELKMAVQHHEMELYFQPKIDLGSGMIRGVESLIRWNHPAKGIVGPDRFIPIAEQTGNINELSQWAVGHAVHTMARWHELGHKMGIAVNISTQDLENASLVRSLGRALSQSHVDPSFLTIEITESVLMSDPASSIETLNALRAFGVKLSMDDFGTGYSSLSYLHELDVDEVKIDRSFIKDMLANMKHEKIVHTVIHLAHDLGLSVTAEGVENQQVYDALKTLHCDLAQGYFMGKPMREEDFLKWLQSSGYGSGEARAKLVSLPKPMGGSMVIH